MQEKREFKVHDRVTKPEGTTGIAIGTVVRTTKTMVMVQYPGHRVETRYRHDGRLIGGGDWNSHWINHLTDEDHQQMAWQNLKSLAGRLEEIADEHGRKDAVLQLQIQADKFITHINNTEDQK